MLPPFIIEEIRKREREEQARQDERQPRLELPIPGGAPSRRDPSPPSTKNDDEGRGVIIIDL